MPAVPDGGSAQGIGQRQLVHRQLQAVCAAGAWGWGTRGPRGGGCVLVDAGILAAIICFGGKGYVGSLSTVSDNFM